LGLDRRPGPADSSCSRRPGPSSRAGPQVQRIGGMWQPDRRFLRRLQCRPGGNRLQFGRRMWMAAARRTNNALPHVGRPAARANVHSAFSGHSGRVRAMSGCRQKAARVSHQPPNPNSQYPPTPGLRQVAARPRPASGHAPPSFRAWWRSAAASTILRRQTSQSRSTRPARASERPRAAPYSPLSGSPIKKRGSIGAAPQISRLDRLAGAWSHLNPDPGPRGAGMVLVTCAPGLRD